MTRYASIFLILLITLLSGTVLAVMTGPDGSMPHVAIRQDTGQTKTHHYDQVGNTLLRTGDSGKEIGKAEYSAYGICYLTEGDMTTPFLYNGQWGVQTDIYREDESRARTGHNAQNLCTTRALALNLTRLEATHKRGIKGRVKRAGWDNSYLEKILKI